MTNTRNPITNPQRGDTVTTSDGERAQVDLRTDEVVHFYYLDGEDKPTGMRYMIPLKMWHTMFKEPTNEQAQRLDAEPSTGPCWYEEHDDNDNSIWEAPSPYHDEGCIYWRLKQRLVGNAIEWYAAHDAELMAEGQPESWPSLEEAQAAVAEEHREIIRDVQQEQGQRNA